MMNNQPLLQQCQDRPERYFYVETLPTSAVAWGACAAGSQEAHVDGQWVRVSRVQQAPSFRFTTTRIEQRQDEYYREYDLPNTEDVFRSRLEVQVGKRWELARELSAPERMGLPEMLRVRMFVPSTYPKHFATGGVDNVKQLLADKKITTTISGDNKYPKAPRVFLVGSGWADEQVKPHWKRPDKAEPRSSSSEDEDEDL